jgi:carbonic anhydrase
VETFRDVEADVRRSIQRVRRSPFLTHTTEVRGFVVDVETGRLTEVAPAQS